ncbi:N-6 DNA methylase [Spongisporangium articulatum]|uniref:site-specific DNA-methyltransferase (adenine-specific) n=1 Tax=Spongisporangium articulatum TaxID=3362603 RepID=A0ABW8APA6_9ACTN
MAAETLKPRLLAAAARVPVEQRGEGWRAAAVLDELRRAQEQGQWDDVRSLASGYDALLLVTPVETAEGGVALVAAGSGERRRRGAFSTPPGYAAELAARALPAVIMETSTAPAAGVARAQSRSFHDHRERVVVDPACGAGALLRAALARLLALGVAPADAARAVHGVDDDPVAVALCRAALRADLAVAGFDCPAEAFDDQVVVGDALLGLDWAATFPHVLDRPDVPPAEVTGWRGGFDAVVANPPWERMKVHARDWSGEPPPGLRTERAEAARAVRAAGRHPLTGAGELNAYLPFVETCWRLLGPGGRAAVLVPAGIASDRSAARLIEGLVAAGGLGRLDLIEPVEPIFAGVSARIGVAVMELAAVGEAPGARMAVGLRDPAERPADREFPLTADLLRTVNPNTATAPLFTSTVDARLVTRVHREVPVLARRVAFDGAPLDPLVDENGWQVRLVTSLHMTRDARWFATAPGPGLVPLVEAKHCGLLDPRGGSTPAPRYWVPENLMHDRYGELTARGWLAGYRNVATTDSPRTLLPTPLPVTGVGNSMPLVHAPRLPLLLAALASLPVDYLLRQKHTGANVNFFKLEQVPVPPPAAYDAEAPWARGRTVGEWVTERLVAAVHWPDDGSLAGLAAELGVRPGPSTAATRAQARAELDAAHAVLLGFSRADLTHAIGTFGALRAREVAATGRFGTAERVTAAFSTLCPDG